jgi:DNA repair protein RadC
MKDLDKEMMAGKPVSRKMRALLDKEKSAARERIVERGIVHFRADQEFMDLLLKTAERSKIAPGTLCRRIVWDYLQSEKKMPGVAERSAQYLPKSDDVMEKLNEIQELVEQALRERGSTQRRNQKPTKK